MKTISVCPANNGGWHLTCCINATGSHDPIHNNGDTCCRFESYDVRKQQ